MNEPISAVTDLLPISPHTKDLGGGFTVRRVLPHLQHPAIGPFVFFDHFGPVTTNPGDNHDVRPHPHVGLATVTYLFEGAIVHRDSTGVERRIEPGAINWMTSGRGIVHSERAPDDLRDRPFVRHGLQLWTALPAEHEETEAAFEHTPADRIPLHIAPGVEACVAVGRAHGMVSPVSTLSPTLLVDYRLQPGASITLPGSDEATERGIYGIEGSFEIDNGDGHVQTVESRQLVVLPAGRHAVLRAGATAARVILLGGTPLGHRFMSWNFVSTRRERITEAAEAWERDGMGHVANDDERIPLPANRPTA